ncbi:Ig-like domain-containing protein [Candidatus Bathyarchaeota archaeon]|nr:Ig-like domain-containing protein [Candidatus Bathyarchaeota archaeon]MBT7347766.1 Ig-like domain-containing protein [Candidatus Bathyarchaeota archaeon]
MNKFEKNPSRKLLLIIALITIATIIYHTEHVSASTTKIVVTPTPSAINTDGRTHEILTIELQTNDDAAFLAPYDIQIQLSSSNLNIGTVEKYVTISEGKSYVKADFTTTANAGITIISATSPGYLSEDARIQTFKSDFDSRLLVYASPNSMPAKPDETGSITVQIIRSDGEPYYAADDIDIKLTSSNHTICTVTEDLTIYRGENFATTSFQTTGDHVGEALISAQADGFSPGNDIINTLNYTGKPARVSIFYGPDLVLSDGETHEAVTIQIQDENGNPTRSPTSRTIYLSSSNINLVTIDNSVTISPGEFHGTAEITTYNQNGESFISASSPGLYPDYEEITVGGQIPTVINILAHPNMLLADGSEYDIITVHLLDEEGKPVEPRDDFEIYLVSSNTDVGTLAESLTIEAGNSYATIPFLSGEQSGKTTLIAFSPGVEPQETRVETVTYGLNVTLTTPLTIRINQTFISTIKVASNGESVPGAEIVWSVIGGEIIAEDQITDEDGIATLELIQKYNQLKISAEISKTGYDSNEASKSIRITQDIEQTELTVTILGNEVKVFTLLIGLAVVIAVALAAYVYLKYKNSREQEPDDLEIYT